MHVRSMHAFDHAIWAATPQRRISVMRRRLRREPHTTRPARPRATAARPSTHTQQLTSSRVPAPASAVAVLSPLPIARAFCASSFLPSVLRLSHRPAVAPATAHCHCPQRPRPVRAHSDRTPLPWPAPAAAVALPRRQPRLALGVVPDHLAVPPAAPARCDPRTAPCRGLRWRDPPCRPYPPLPPRFARHDLHLAPVLHPALALCPGRGRDLQHCVWTRGSRPEHQLRGRYPSQRRRWSPLRQRSRPHQWRRCLLWTPRLPLRPHQRPKPPPARAVERTEAPNEPGSL